MTDIEAFIAESILTLGISPHVKGYHYIIKCILWYLEKRQPDLELTAKMYPALAEYYHSSAGSVERAIRHAIRTGWERRDRKFADVVFMNSLQSKTDVPTTSLFITGVALWVKREKPEFFT